MRVLPGLTNKASHLLLHWRWLIVFVAALAAVSLQILENILDEGEWLNLDFAGEVAVVGLILPLFGGLTLTAFARAEAESGAIRAATIRAERHRIARDLHDSLAQNLGYLRLKLDQFSHDNTLQQIPAIGQDLQRMSEVANAAYEQVQEELVCLYHTSSSDLQTALLSQARLIASRAGFEVQFVSEGVPRSLPPDAQVHLYYLLHEALTNIEKHAAAQSVRIKLEWVKDTLTITLADDGHGFVPDEILSSEHLGLSIMRERAREANAQLLLASLPGAGTQLMVRFPLTRAGILPASVSQPTTDASQAAAGTLRRR